MWRFYGIKKQAVIIGVTLWDDIQPYGKSIPRGGCSISHSCAGNFAKMEM